MDLKKQAALKASEFISNEIRLGLGGGSTIAHLVSLLVERIQNGLKVKIYSSSEATRQLLIQVGLSPEEISQTDLLDLYVDGCDQVDRDLNVLKSMGGIFTQEKLLAAMATRFLVIGDGEKFSERFDSRFPLSLEVLPDALLFVTRRVSELLPGVPICPRRFDVGNAPTRTPGGNLILDLQFKSWPALGSLNSIIKSIPGVLESSLFYQMATQVILANESGVEILTRRQLSEIG